MGPEQYFVGRQSLFSVVSFYMNQSLPSGIGFLGNYIWAEALINKSICL